MPRKRDRDNTGSATIWVIALVVCLTVPLVPVIVVPLLLGVSMRFAVVLIGAIAAAGLAFGLMKLLDRIRTPAALGSPGYAWERVLKVLLLFVYPAFLALLWYLIASSVAGVTVYIDNATNQGFGVTVDGKELATVAAGTSRWDSWRYGNHEVIVRDANGQVRDTFQVSIAKEGPWVFNLFGAGRYTRGSVAYGTASGGGPNVAIADRWFIADVNFLFKEPPESIQTKSSGETRTFLVRTFPVQEVNK